MHFLPFKSTLLRAIQVFLIIALLQFIPYERLISKKVTVILRCNFIVDYMKLVPVTSLSEIIYIVLVKTVGETNIIISPFFGIKA